MFRLEVIKRTFIVCLKMPTENRQYDWQLRMSFVDEFQMESAATRKPREPNVKLYDGTVSRLLPEERRFRNGTYGNTKLDRYAGEYDDRHLNASTAILCLIRHSIGSQ